MTDDTYSSYTYYDSPIGRLLLAANGAGLTQVSLDWRARPLPTGAREEATPLLAAARQQLAEYFAGQRRVFDLPLAQLGTQFQQRAWAGLRQIPYGETRSYGQQAAAIGCPGGARAVGRANNRNQLLILTPCHRVIGADGRLVGFGGGLEVKKQLLLLENPQFRWRE